MFSIGAGSEDLGFRAQADILFHTVAARSVHLKIHDSDGTAVTASLLIQDALGRIYPSLSKRLAPDFFFQPQVYRENGETLLLPAGTYRVETGRGPEYRKQVKTFSVADGPATWELKLQRWIDPARLVR